MTIDQGSKTCGFQLASGNAESAALSSVAGMVERAAAAIAKSTRDCAVDPVEAAVRFHLSAKYETDAALTQHQPEKR